MADTPPGRLRPNIADGDADTRPHHEARYSILDIEEAMASGFVTGCKRLAADKEFMATYWRRGFEELATHGGNGASQWVGKRILTAFIIAATGAGIYWLVKTGAMK